MPIFAWTLLRAAATKALALSGIIGTATALAEADKDVSAAAEAGKSGFFTALGATAGVFGAAALLISAAKTAKRRV